MFVFISHFKTPITGAHHRYQRLVKYIAKTESVFWVTPSKLDSPNCKTSWVNAFFLKPSILLLLNSILSSLYLFNNRKKIKKIVVFGETTLLSALFVKLVTGCPLSIGVRSNVLKRQLIVLEGISGVKLLKIKSKFFITNKVIQFSYYFADEIICQTDKAAEELINSYKVNRGKVKSINNDLPNNFGLIKSEYPKQPCKLLFIGGESKIKGLDILLQALKNISDTKDFPYLEITLIGVSKEYVSHTYPYLSGSINITKVIERTSNVFREMLLTDLLIVPSREDQFPNVILEAMAIGLPVIGSNVDGIAYMLASTENTFEPFVPDLVDRLRHILSIDGYASCIENIVVQSKRFDFNWEETYLSLINEKKWAQI
ncbi:glycosyltransferase family 4 protein [Pseudoalteromonas sp. bablab_jr011]|uniref:glycosyltransferase family 4 protein n=1 Tax=Pseudoalteromonas sp. bablab_jr011 TaxID=2755062 RepID=UPI0018F3E633|nr:glycosyltransferase family 4 protein [Pseudoalteromonas sp. bablab_jr011]